MNGILCTEASGVSLATWEGSGNSERQIRLKKSTAVLGLLLGTLASQAAVSGTNAVTLMADNITNASDTAWPIVIGIILGLGALGVFMKFGRRAGFRA